LFVKLFLEIISRRRKKKKECCVVPEDNGTFDRVLYMGLYMAVIPTRGEAEAEKKRFFGHGGEDGGGMAGVVRVLVVVWVLVWCSRGAGVQGYNDRQSVSLHLFCCGLLLV
jgi:hypothetical protein